MRAFRTAALPLLLSLAAAPLSGWGGAPDWVRALHQTPSGAHDEETPAVRLLDEMTTTVAGSGDFRQTRRIAIRILQTAGRDYGRLHVYSSSYAKVTSMRGWGITKSGVEFQVADHEAVETSAFEGELYSDVKMRVIEIPGAEPGSTVAFEYQTRQKPYGLEDVWIFQDEIPLLNGRYAVILPENWSCEARWSNYRETAPQIAGNRWTWELNNVEAIRRQDSMLHHSAIAGRMAVDFVSPEQKLKAKQHRSWQDVARWYAQLANPRRASSPQIRDKATTLAAARQTWAEKAAALASFAQRDVRYVAIQIGIGGIQPHNARDVFANRYGDCKDKVTLLAAMLLDAGIDSFPVLVNTSRGVVKPEFATMAAFNHVIIAIRVPQEVDTKSLRGIIKHPKLGRLLIFDPTDDTVPFGDLPLILQRSRGLLVTSDGGELIDVPALSPEANRLSIHARLNLDASGALNGEVRETRSGWVAAFMRATLRAMNESERLEFVQHRVTRDAAQPSVSGVAVDNLDDLESDLVLRYKIMLPNYARRTASMLMVRPRVLGSMVSAIVDLKDRKYPLETDGPSLIVNDIEIALPGGFVAEELPSPQSIASSSLRYTSNASFDGKTIKYKRELRTEGFSVALEGLPEYNRALSQILADERRSALLKGQ